VLLGYASGRWYTLDAVWGQKSPAGVEELISATARRDGLAVPVRLEQEPGASGAHVVDHYVRSVLPGYDVQGKRSSGDKAVRAGPLASACENGNWSVLRRWWSEEYVAQFLGFPFLNHDDFVDATSGAMADITNRIHAEPDMSNIIMITAASKWTATA
jgi:predicted phage terminase large subunit-like protein